MGSPHAGTGTVRDAKGKVGHKSMYRTILPFENKRGLYVPQKRASVNVYVCEFKYTTISV